MTSPGRNKHIVLVSSGQPSANPRLVKEAVAFSEAGFQVTVLYCPLSPWADAYDEQLFHNHPSISWQRVGAHTVYQKWHYKYARLRQKIYSILSKIFSQNPVIAIRSFVLYSQELNKAAKRIKADFYIGHNLGALQAVINAAKKHQGKAVFDFEDYHRGEDVIGSKHWNMVTIIENYFAPQLTYATTASPLISYQYQQHFPQLEIHTINNCFPIAYAQKEILEIPSLPLKIFWFSQFIGPNRGLETVIEGIGKTKNNKIQLTLLGNLSEANRNYFKELAKQQSLMEDQIIFVAPVAESDIPLIAAQHHIGLACEVPYIMNRELCLTNKIFMYLLAGNAILYSNTKAQQLFWEQNTNTGSIYAQNDSDTIASILLSYLKDETLLNKQRKAALELAKQAMNWELEQQKLLSIISKHS